MDEFYVYEHWRPDINACFYVGKGKNKRAWDLKNRKNPHFKSVVSKLIAMGFAVDVRLIAVNLSEQDALALEIERIAFYGMENLTNMTRGGDGLVNPSEEVKQKISVAHKKRFENPEERAKLGLIHKGKKTSEETKAKISRAMKKRRHSEETKKIMSESAKKRGISHETRLKINAARIGLKRQPITEEARQNMCKAAKLREEKKRLQRQGA